MGLWSMDGTRCHLHRLVCSHALLLACRDATYTCSIWYMQHIIAYGTIWYCHLHDLHLARMGLPQVRQLRGKARDYATMTYLKRHS